MFQAFGWLGSMLLALCGVPQALKTWKTKWAADLSWGFLAMWWLGEVLTASYVLHGNYQQGQWQLPLLANYSLNFAVVTYLLWAKWRYSKD